MDAILGFFSNLILFTAGLIVAILWLIAIMLIAVEVFDTITGNDSTLFPDKKEDDQ